MIAFINIVRNFHSVKFCGSGDKLPKTRGFGGGNHIFQSAFGHTEVLEIVGEAFFFQDGFNHWKVACSAFYNLDSFGMLITVDYQFLVQSLPYVVNVQRNILAGKIKCIGEWGSGSFVSVEVGDIVVGSEIVLSALLFADGKAKASR